MKDDKPDATAVVPGTDDAEVRAGSAQSARRLGAGRQRRPAPRRAQRRLEPRLVRRAHAAASRRAIFGGWTISGIASWQTGQPYSAFVNTDLNNDGNARNDRAPGFARNSFRLPSQFSIDPRVTKDIGIFAGARLQLIAEAFNLFNRSNVNGVRNTYYAVATTGGVPTKFTLQDIPTSNPFGLPTSSFGPRILQFAAKITF